MMEDFVDAVVELEEGRLGIADFKTRVTSLAWVSTMLSSPSASSLLWGIRSILYQWEDAAGEISARSVALALIQEVRDCGFDDMLERQHIKISRCAVKSN
jgi:hypothetical protein